MRILFATILALIALATCPRVRAQDSDATHAAAARALFSEGVAATDAGDWAQASERFRAALALRPSSVIALNLAVALGHLGRVVEATELLRGVLLDRAANDTVRASAQETLATLEPRVAWLELRLEGAIDGVSVQVDALQVADVLLGTAIPLDPGPHHVAALRDDEECAAADVELVEGERRTMALSVPARVVLPEPVDETLHPVVPLTPVDQGPDPLLLGLGIGGGVLVIGGVVGLVLALTLAGGNDPFVGNAGFVEVGP